MREKNAGVISEVIARFYLALSEVFTTATVALAGWAEWCVVVARYFSNKAKQQLTEEEILRMPQ